ncbi:sugar isomerase domain-containing protein [Paenibacillus sp. CC-CFT747]|nr:sugar isomerase domain-containing protein [Paenibacillus sp. CC-CFT747]
MEAYYRAVTQVLETIQTTQQEAMEKAAAACAKAIASKRAIYLFGTGHSHMLAEEPYYRAGGLVPVIPILETGLMLHEGAVKSTKLERLTGYAAILLEQAGVGDGDVLFIISNSGINALPVEMAEEASRRGLPLSPLPPWSIRGMPSRVRRAARSCTSSRISCWTTEECRATRR